jgi:hypothetical protein
MTHEYIIGLGGQVLPDREGTGATAVGWAADAILAVGSDERVRAISRGDSTFLDLGGCVVTPLPADLDAAEALVRDTTDGSLDVGALLIGAGLLEPTAGLEPGSPADLAFWRAAALVAVLRAGHFTRGDAHRGPFPPPAPGATATPRG